MGAAVVQRAVQLLIGLLVWCGPAVGAAEAEVALNVVAGHIRHAALSRTTASAFPAPFRIVEPTFIPVQLSDDDNTDICAGPEPDESILDGWSNVDTHVRRALGRCPSVAPFVDQYGEFDYATARAEIGIISASRPRSAWRQILEEEVIKASLERPTLHRSSLLMLAQNEQPQAEVCWGILPDLETALDGKTFDPEVRRALAQCPAAFPFVNHRGDFDYGKARSELGAISAELLETAWQMVLGDEVTKAFLERPALHHSSLLVLAQNEFPQAEVCRGSLPDLETAPDGGPFDPEVRRALVQCPAAFPFVNHRGDFDYGKARSKLGVVSARLLRTAWQMVLGDEIIKAFLERPALHHSSLLVLAQNEHPQVEVCQGILPDRETALDGKTFDPEVRRALAQCPAAFPFVNYRGDFDYGKARSELGRAAASELRLGWLLALEEQVIKA